MHLLELPDDLLQRILAHTLPPPPKPLALQSYAPALTCRRLRHALLCVVHTVAVGDFRSRSPHAPTAVGRRAGARARAMLRGGLRGCIALRRLSVGFCDGVGSEDLTAFGRGWAGCALEGLELLGCDHVSDAAVEELARGVLGRETRELVVVRHPVADGDGMSDQALAVLAEVCELERLSLWMWSFGDLGLEAVGAMASLRKLNLRGVTGLDDEKFARMVAGLTDLRELTLKNAPSLGDAAITAFASCRGRERMRSIQCENVQLTSEGLRELVEGCPDLETVHLSSCQNVTDESGRWLGALSQLSRLDIVNCYGVTDEILVSVYAGCRKLRALRLEFCPNVTSAGLFPLSRLPCLSELSLSYCSEISIGAARVIAACRHLELVELVKTRIGDPCLDLICAGEAAQTGRLRQVDISQCADVSSLAVREARDLCGSLSVISDHSSTSPFRASRGGQSSVAASYP
jgi:hypothetical protein